MLMPFLRVPGYAPSKMVSIAATAFSCAPRVARRSSLIASDPSVPHPYRPSLLPRLFAPTVSLRATNTPFRIPLQNTVTIVGTVGLAKGPR